MDGEHTREFSKIFTQRTRTQTLRRRWWYSRRTADYITSQKIKTHIYIFLANIPTQRRYVYYLNFIVFPPSVLLRRLILLLLPFVIRSKNEKYIHTQIYFSYSFEQLISISFIHLKWAIHVCMFNRESSAC